MSSLRKNVLSKGSKRFTAGMVKDFTPTKWDKYFDNKREVKVGENVFNVYAKGVSGPLLVLLHGGGYSALTWSLFAEEITRKVDCQVLAIDLRGHGLTKTSDDADLALETLAADVDSIILQLYDEDEVPPVVLIGHSMGGAVAVEATYLVKNAIALCVIDVVEGSALESLSAMQSILRGRPTSFKSIEQAIQWRSGQTHNLEAARISMPGQIKNIKSDALATSEIGEGEGSSQAPRHVKLVHQRSADCIAEVDEKGDDEKAEEAAQTSESHDFVKPTELNCYTWRIDLSKTENFWNGWFKGLSQKFLNIGVPKVLLLANIHGLDTALTIGQMQGKFQLQVLPKSGHAIHEDQPGNVADIIAGFLVKQKLSLPKEGFVLVMPAC